ncbi:hypothetical protein [Thermococcus sp.]|uniref:hypothetical protein n=1 Tax=Thermococcus sp. TaxID=35749 RepID=UPI002604101A|nr:hypothetical protein [Thermococcus sp.]
MGTIYRIAVFLTALSLFWPVVYGNVRVFQELPGNPVLQAALGTLIFGALAYLTYEGEEEAEEKEFTASG